MSPSQAYVRYTGMPIAPVEANMRRFPAGALTLGVEFRLLTEELLTALGKTAEAHANGLTRLQDAGVSLHVFAPSHDGDLERLRFDCFSEEPHYHYVCWHEGFQDIVYLDSAMTGDVLSWALERIATRMPQLLRRAGVEEPLAAADLQALEQVLPQVASAAYEARYHSDREQLGHRALAAAKRAQAGMAGVK